MTWTVQQQNHVVSINNFSAVSTNFARLTHEFGSTTLSKLWHVKLSYFVVSGLLPTAWRSGPSLGPDLDLLESDQVLLHPMQTFLTSDGTGAQSVANVETDDSHPKRTHIFPSTLNDSARRRFCWACGHGLAALSSCARPDSLPQTAVRIVAFCSSDTLFRQRLVRVLINDCSNQN